jgi:exopolysaccharide biosynthesis polyprenyl glycosylphosphotransferase
VLTIPLITLGRVLTSRVQRSVRSRHPERLLVIGTGDIAHMILQKTLQVPQLGFKVVGFADGQASNGDIAGVPILGPTTELPKILRDHNIQQVVIALPQASHEELLDLISICEDEHAEVSIFPDLFQIVASELSIDDLGGLPLLTVRDVALHGWKLTAKRAMDIVVSGLVLVFISPLMMLIALLIKLESKGPVFYSQVRVGLDGKPFDMIKFRSMRTDAEKETGPVWATADDPRKTRLGSFLRKTSLDEFPQFINVLLGDMSLVGPRPERPVFVEQFRQVVPRYMERHREKAGITGWAQVNGLRGETSIVERTKYDLYYIENWSLLFDLKIVLRTFINFFRRDGNAY